MLGVPRRGRKDSHFNNVYALRISVQSTKGRLNIGAANSALSLIWECGAHLVGPTRKLEDLSTEHHFFDELRTNQIRNLLAIWDLQY